jgi:hypothetical protein
MEAAIPEVGLQWKACRLKEDMEEDTMEDVEMAGEMVEGVVVTGEMPANRLTRSTRTVQR